MTCKGAGWSGCAGAEVRLTGKFGGRTLDLDNRESGSFAAFELQRVMDDKIAFVRHSKRLRLIIFVAGLIMLCTMPFYPRAGFAGWTVFVIMFMIPLARLRCWNCGERLLKDGGSHIEYCKTGILTWDICHHKTCGAELR